MPTWYYFARPRKMAFHDLTLPTSETPPNLRSLLGLGMKFIPNPSKTQNWSAMKTKTLDRLKRDLQLKAFFAEQEMDQSRPFNKKIYVKSKWKPAPYEFPRELPWRLNRFDIRMSQIFKRRNGKPNLLPHQVRALKQLQKQSEFIVVNADKNLGPCVIELKRYIEMAFRDHLNDTKTYTRITKNNLKTQEVKIRKYVNDWMKEFKEELSKEERKFIRHKTKECTEFFPLFYLTMKVHKNPIKSRPIVSCAGSFLEGLGKWVDLKLKPVAQSIPSYFKNSTELVEHLKTIGKLPEEAKLFTADAKSMYTNIPTDKAMEKIEWYLNKNNRKWPQIPIDALVKALDIIMRNNVFQFGDTFWKQNEGTAMGTPPAPPYATTYYGIHEEDFLQTWKPNLITYKRFLDDVFGIWIPTNPFTKNEDWQLFKQTMNNESFGLEWEFSELTNSVDFMDITITINEKKQIVTTLYQKPTNLHLYIPPHSAHPPGLLTGIIHGTVHRIRNICTSKDDQNKHLKEFLNNLRARGYNTSQLLPIFKQAIKANKDTDKQKENNKKVFLHIRFHPNAPPAQELQKAWTQCIANPMYKKPLADVKNRHGKRIGQHRLIVAYNRNPNLSNLLSYKNIEKFGTSISSFCD